MIIDFHEKLDVSPEWFEEQAGHDGWHKWLCQLLSIYKVKDEAGAEIAAEKLIAVGVDERLVKKAIE